MRAPASSLIGSRVFLSKEEGETSEYELQEILGSGSHGSVYAAQNELHDSVAVKVGHREKDRVGFEHESKVGRAVDHPAVLKAVGVGELRSQVDSDTFEPALVMERVQGRPLEKVFPPFHPNRSVGQSVHMIREVLDGLEAMHGAGIAHRDIRPKNLMVDVANDHAMKLVDFGLSRDVSPGGIRDDLRNSAAALVYLLTGMLAPNGAWQFKKAALGAVPDKLVDGQSLRGVLRRAFKPPDKGGYPSAREFSEALRPFEDKPI